jgi:hypothetical protein
VDKPAHDREISTGKRFTRLVNGERGGYLDYAMWRRYLKLAHGFTAAALPRVPADRLGSHEPGRHPQGGDPA